MITRSACIKRAQDKMLQGSTDPLWSNVDWSDIFQSAVMRVWSEILDLDQAFFCERKVEISHAGEGVYNLPSDFYELLRVQEASGAGFYKVSLKDEREKLKPGWVINNGKLLIVNWTPLPSSVFIDYRRYPKEFPDWTGVDDPENALYELDHPFNNQRGLRLFSSIIPILAKVKDESLTETEFQVFLLDEIKNFDPRFVSDMSSKTS
ncbi:MAG: hypothetical protein PHV05_07740 [Candidatus Riflebacteria bacterium]|nr:hypothetical protein [Candidatus Riflebacteria bacterium]